MRDNRDNMNLLAGMAGRQPIRVTPATRGGPHDGLAIAAGRPTLNGGKP